MTTVSLFAVKFELQSFGPSIVRIRSIETGKFLSIDSEGTLQTRVSTFLMFAFLVLFRFFFFCFCFFVCFHFCSIDCSNTWHFVPTT